MPSIPGSQVPAAGADGTTASVRLSVAVDTPQHSGLDGLLEYASDMPLAPGSVVRVPLGRRYVPGVVWEPASSRVDSSALRPVDRVLAALLPLPKSWRDLVTFAARYYQRSVGELALQVLPPELRRLDEAQIERRLTRLQRALAADASAAATMQTAPPALNDEQAQAAARLRGWLTLQSPPTVLLHGVTGSGKTEVYLQAVESVLQAGRQALVLVPEINLTPQLEARFAARFAGRSMVALHSGLTPAQRLRHWLAAHLGLADIVLGTRLAIFTPMPRLGLVVVDEEHDPSYKQQEGARYSARDLAVYRGRAERACVLLGSATPSLETWQRAQRGRYEQLVLGTRIGNGALPAVRLIDMARATPPATKPPPVLSAPLLDALRDRVERGEQSLVLLNRRGWAPVLHCTACNWKSACPHCSAWRVFHKLDRSLRCHHCGLAEAVPRACPDCGQVDIAPIGRGTERLEEQLALALPQARIARIDADSTRGKGMLEAQLGAVHAGLVDVLVGTQMIAKGHDFRRVTLVAAVNPDSALFASDFRAGERLFALLMQAAGRAGRDAQHASASEMWVQTWHPTHPLYMALRAHDFARFAASMLRERETAGLPPTTYLALLRAEARQFDVARGFLVAAQEAIAAGAPPGLRLYPPVPMALQRVADVERVQMLIESASRPLLQRFLADSRPALQAVRQAHRGVIRWAIDVDPLAI